MSLPLEIGASQELTPSIYATGNNTLQANDMIPEELYDGSPLCSIRLVCAYMR